MPKLIRLFDDCSIINGKFCNVQYHKILKFKKSHADKMGNLIKYTTAKNIKIGVNHDHATNNQLNRENFRPDYKANSPIGKTWLYYPIVMADEKTGKKRYVKFEQWNDLILWEKHYEYNEKKISTLDKYKPMLLASEYKHYQSDQPTERYNQYLTINLDNIIWIEVNGKIYTCDK